MKIILKNQIGVRLTDEELERVNALKIAMGFPSLPNTTLCRHLLVAGLADEEQKRKAVLVPAKGRKGAAK